MQYIEQLINSPHLGETLTMVIVGVLAVQFLVKLFDWCIERFGIQTTGMRREKQQLDSIDKLEKEVNIIKEDVRDIEENAKITAEKRAIFENSVSSSLQEIKDNLTNSRIETLRENILDFGNACKVREYNKESYDNILRSYDIYEQLIQETGQTNGKTEMAINYIRKRYAEYQEKGFPQY